VVEHEQIELRSEGAITILHLRGQFLGGEETDALQEGLQELADERRRVIIDMKHVTFVNSSFLGALLAAHTHANRRGTSITITDMKDSIADILALTRMDTVLNVSPSVDDALDQASRTIS